MTDEEDRMPCPASSRGLCAPPYCDGYLSRASRPGWTPTTGEVRDWWMQGTAEDVSAFDRWLAEHDREVAAQALRDAARPLIAFDILDSPVPVGIDVPDDYERGMNDGGALIVAHADRIAAGEEP
jgi:hypothetical protein